MHQRKFLAAGRLTNRTNFAGPLAAICLTAPAWAFAQLADTAQSPSAGQLQEVIVTARRVSENVQDVPISVVDLNSTQLNYQGVNTANDLARVAPGLSIMNTAANTGAVTYSIRGQGSTFGSGPGVIPCTIMAPIISAIRALGGMPRLSIGMKQACAAALLADSGAATPSIAPLPNRSGVRDNFVSRL